jgi:glycosyltransferase involved in cell wall biosynthesis
VAKILIVGNPLSPLVCERGLAGREGGHRIAWFSPQAAELPGVDAYSMPTVLSKNFLLRALFEPLYLLIALRKVKPDLIHVHYASRGLSGLALSLFHPLVVTVMGSDILPAVGYRFPYAPFTRWLLDKADLITSKSAFIDQALLAIGDYRSKIARVTWGVDLQKFQPTVLTDELRTKLNIPNRALVFFDPRNASPLYNKVTILRGFAQFQKNSSPPAILLVAEQFASTPYLQRLHALANELGIENSVRFVGAIPHSEIAAYYAVADATIAIPDSDGLPQSLYEALACGSFLIMQDLPQYRGIVQDGQTAKLIPRADPGLLADALRWVAENPGQRQLAAKLGRAYVEQEADKTKETAKINQLYAQLLQRSIN